MDDERFETRLDSGIATVAINRAHRHNAFDDAMIGSFVRLLNGLKEEELRAVILTGKGRETFCAGYDINCIDPHQSLDEPLPDERFEPAVFAVIDCDAPVIAAMNGAAFGGGLDLALACDFRLSCAGAKFAMTPCRLGLVYSLSGVSRFVTKLGPQVTRQLFLTGRTIAAPEAHLLNIIDEIVEDEQLPTRARELADEITRLAPLAVKGTRRTIQYLERSASLALDVPAELVQLRKKAFSSEDLQRALVGFKTQSTVRFRGE